MFSEYASRYLSKSQRPVPLFNRQAAGESDVDDYIDDISGSSEEGSPSESDSLHSESESEDSPRNSDDPPSDFLVERPRKSHNKKRALKPKRGLSLWSHGTRPATGSVAPSVDGFAPQLPGSAPALPAVETLSPREPRRESRPVGGAGDIENQVRLARGKPLDNTVAGIYIISAAMSLTTAFLVSFSASGNGSVYAIFVYSARTLATYAALATAVSVLWLYFMRHHARAVVQLSVFAVPALLVTTSATSLLFSVHPSATGWHGAAHAALRVSALLPLALALLWVLYLRRMKDAVGKAADIVALSASVYEECTPMMTVLTLFSGFASLVVTGSWSFFLARAFLEGKEGLLLGAWFTFMYLWTWGLLCALLHSVLASVTAEWYSGRAMDGVLSRSIFEAMAYHFSSACLSALIALLVRLPLLVLPSKLGSFVQRSASVLFHASTARVLSPLTLPTAVVSRSSLNAAAAAVAEPPFTTLDRHAYRLAKLFLVSARVCCSIVIAFVAWIHADRIQDASSAYASVVAVVALFIGWTVMGASENMLSMICDALLVSYALNESSPKKDAVAHLFQNTAPLASNGVGSMLDSHSDSRSDSD